MSVIRTEDAEVMETWCEKIDERLHGGHVYYEDVVSDLEKAILASDRMPGPGVAVAIPAEALIDVVALIEGEWPIKLFKGGVT